MLELWKLRHFVTLARLRNYTKAAEAVHLSQSALSRSISALEDQLQVRLFDRSRRGVELTGAGRHLLPQAEDLLARSTHTEEALRHYARGISGRIAFGVGPFAASYVIPDVIADVVKAAPAMEVEIIIDHVSTLQQMLTSGKIDFYHGRHGVTELPRFVVPQRVEHVVLRAYMRKGHPLATRKEYCPLAGREYPRASPRGFEIEVARVRDPDIRLGYQSTIKFDNAVGLIDVARHSDLIVFAAFAKNMQGMVSLPLPVSDQKHLCYEAAIFTIEGRTLNGPTQRIIGQIGARYAELAHSGAKPVNRKRSS